MKNEAFCISWAGSIDEGVNRNSVGNGDGIGLEERRMVGWLKYSGDFEFVGESGRVLTAEVGVGGYECTLVVELEALALSCNATWESMAGGTSGAKDTFVRVFKDNAASVWKGEVEGTGTKGMNICGGNAGDWIRIYHPLKGRRMVQQTVPVELC